MKYLERDDIQGIVTNGYGKFEAAYGLYRISDAVRARRWLDGISDKVSSADPEAENQRQGFRLQIAFTYPGLGKLGLDEHAFADVSAEFIEPRDLRSHRQRVLQEFEESGPQHWDWGGDQDGEEAVHILLALFAKNWQKLEKLFGELVPSSIDSGLERINDVHYTNRLPGGKEHFGFRDGISQPAIVDGDRRSADAVSAGEFLFGYENEYGCYPPMPTVRDNPDFGLNGTFLVARQLEQNVPKFWQDTMAAVNEDEKRARLLASRRVGRWPNGAPLVFAPRQETLRLAKENEFGYGKDPFGKRCPIGAHVRRANPRDSLAISQDDPTREVRRHRIIRRGRTYGDAIDGAFSNDGDINIDKLKSAESGGRGLFFLCLNTDIGRQFEFILQTWVNNPKFAGGYEEVDPLFKVDRTARSEREDQAPALPNLDIATLDIGADAGGGVSTAGSDWKSIYSEAARSGVSHGSDPKRPSARHYIRVRGGGYFFLPGLKAIRYLAQLGEQQSDRCNDPACDALEKIPPNEDFHTERLVRALTDKVFTNNPPGAAQRDAHPKQHGTVYGQFTVEKDLDERLRKGLFAKAASYEALVRFSNQNNIPKHDYNIDVRGMAVKVCGVQGDMIWHHGKPATSQDFLAITHDVFTTRDVDDFDALIHAVLRFDDGFIKGKITLLRMFLSRFPTRLYILKNYFQAFRRHPNPLHLTYFSTVPYLHGAAQAMKFRFRPSLAQHREAGRLKPQKGQPSNFLQLGMKRVLQEVKHYDFDMEVQLRDAKHNMPIEDPATRWRERDAPFVKVATLTIPSQVFDSPAQLEYGDNLAFSPWHCLKAHRPLGGINRARRVIMREVLSLRRAMNRVRQPEPVSTHEFRSLEP